MVVSMFVMLTTFIVRNEWQACAKINKVLMGVMALHMACPSFEGRSFANCICFNKYKNIVKSYVNKSGSSN